MGRIESLLALLSADWEVAKDNHAKNIGKTFVLLENNDNVVDIIP